MSNSEQEMLWVNGWNELSDFLDTYQEAYLFLPEYIETTLEEAQEWIQNSAYESKETIFKVEFY